MGNNLKKNNMRIFYDHQIFTLQKFGGVSKYFVELIKRLPPNMWYTSTFISNNYYVANENLFKCHKFLSNISFRGKDRILSSLGNLYSIYELKKQSYDVFHQTDYNPYCIDILKKRNIPFVTTCHDLNFATVNKCNYLMNWQKKSMINADAIIAISENTKKELIDLWNIDEKKIHVVYHGVNNIINDNYNRIIEEPYILFVGTRFAFKNFINLLLAFEKLSHKYKDLKLVCVGSKFDKNEIKKIGELKLSNKVKQMSVSDIDLNNLYHFAEAFIYPSISEGFGLPLLEAMANNCPVICSNTSCFPEIAHDAAMYFSPFNIDSIYCAIENVLLSSSVKERLRKNGKERVSLFTWDKSVESHLKVYKSLI